MLEDLRLAGVLETVLYYASDQQDEMERFYENVLGLESLGLGRWSLAFRLGQGVVLLFERERSAAQDEPPAHGASGSIHTAFLAAPGEYEAWKERLADRDVTLVDEIAWNSGALLLLQRSRRQSARDRGARSLGRVGAVRHAQTRDPTTRDSAPSDIHGTCVAYCWNCDSSPYSVRVARVLHPYSRAAQTSGADLVTIATR